MADDKVVQQMEAQREALLAVDFDFLTPLEILKILLRRHADFHLYIMTPVIERTQEPKVIMPEKLKDSEDYEFVYPIMDFGDQFSMAKGDDGVHAGASMCKLYYTIEKVIYILSERLKAQQITDKKEVQVALGGHELAQRYGFASIINLQDLNVVVTNFDPGTWGEGYLQNVKEASEQGFGYPPKAPRPELYQQPSSAPSV